MEAVGGEGDMAAVCTCGGGAAKTDSVEQHVLRHVSSSPGPLVPSSVEEAGPGLGWTLCGALPGGLSVLWTCRGGNPPCGGTGR